MILIFIFTACFIALDQLSKYWIVRTFELGKSVPLIPNVIHLTYHTNTGAAFGVFKKFTPHLTFISFFFVVILIYFLVYKTNRVFIQYSLAMVLAGAIGNLIDRVRLGYVVDFIDLRVWPIFNIADSCITVGVCFILLDMIFSKRNRKAPL